MQDIDPRTLALLWAGVCAVGAALTGWLLLWDP